MGVKSFDHVGVVVDDLEAATTFFLDLGFERAGAGSVEGEWVETSSASMTCKRSSSW